MSKKFVIAALEGDGIGPEIMAVALDVLRAIESQSDVEFDVRHAPFGVQAYFDTGDAVPGATQSP